MNLAQAITTFSIEVLQMEKTKNSPEMVAAIAELINQLKTDEKVSCLQSRNRQEKYPEYLQ